MVSRARLFLWVLLPSGRPCNVHLLPHGQLLISAYLPHKSSRVGPPSHEADKEHCTLGGLAGTTHRHRLRSLHCDGRSVNECVHGVALRPHLHNAQLVDVLKLVEAGDFVPALHMHMEAQG